MNMTTPQDAKLDRIVAEARRNAEQRDQERVRFTSHLRNDARLSMGCR